MLSGKGNAGERWKTIGLISKKATLHVQHTFFWYISLPLFYTTTTRNFLVTRFFRSLFFSLPLIFILHWWPLALSPPLQNFHVVLPTKNCLLCFLSLTLNLCRPFSRWASPACRLLSLFLCVSLALYSKFVGHDDQSKLNTLENTDTETISAFHFPLHWLFSCFCFTRRGWLCDFPSK